MTVMMMMIFIASFRSALLPLRFARLYCFFFYFGFVFFFCGNHGMTKYGARKAARRKERVRSAVGFGLPEIAIDTADKRGRLHSLPLHLLARAVLHHSSSDSDGSHRERVGHYGNTFRSVSKATDGILRRGLTHNRRCQSVGTGREK